MVGRKAPPGGAGNDNSPRKTGNPIDQHVGARVRLRRLSLGMSQDKLGESIGVTFQQIQKYEKGTNRIGASRLQDIARVLGVPPAFFFDGAEAAGTNDVAYGTAEPPGAPYVADSIEPEEGARLNRAFVRIADPLVRRQIIELVTSIADAQAKSPKRL